MKVNYIKRLERNIKVKLLYKKKGEKKNMKRLSKKKKHLKMAVFQKK